MKRLQWIALGLLLTAASALHAAPRHVTVGALGPDARQLFQQSMDLGDHFFDEETKLVRNPDAANEAGSTGAANRSAAESNRLPDRYLVRESSWYALGLLLRDAPGDRQRAAAILNAVLKEQYTAPGVRWYGTYKRTPEEPDPAAASLIWRDYDPNWRVFIGTTFAIILIEYPDRIPAGLAGQMYKAIDTAIEGEMAEGRLVPTYTNIALMYGFLWDFSAMHNHRADWRAKAAAWNETVYRIFSQYGTFNEYNSPTYCGVDLYGLALWRDYGSTPRMKLIGSRMEAALWRDTASYYQPQLRNISGPYDRAYGMDMESYVSVMGVWMRSVLNARMAPLPVPTPTTDHLADIWFAPHIAILGTRIPADALTKMKSFSGEHLVRKQIDAKRVSTAWIGRDAIFGGEATTKTKDSGMTTQFHPATVQWRTPSGEIGWVQLVQSPPVDATADKHGLTIATDGTVRLRIHAKGYEVNRLSATLWQLPGLSISVTSDASGFNVENAADGADLVYSGIRKMRLEIKPARSGDAASRGGL
jgi:hypothetical protein